MKANSTIRPRGGLLQALLDEPPSLARVAIACRICNHPSECRSEPQPLASGDTLHWCALCGAAVTTEAGVVPEPDAWLRPAALQLVTRAMVAACEPQAASAIEEE